MFDCVSTKMQKDAIVFTSALRTKESALGCLLFGSVLTPSSFSNFHGLEISRLRQIDVTAKLLRQISFATWNFVRERRYGESRRTVWKYFAKLRRSKRLVLSV